MKDYLLPSLTPTLNRSKLWRQDKTFGMLWSRTHKQTYLPLQEGKTNIKPHLKIPKDFVQPPPIFFRRKAGRVRINISQHLVFISLKMYINSFWVQAQVFWKGWRIIWSQIVCLLGLWQTVLTSCVHMSTQYCDCTSFPRSVILRNERAWKPRES